MRFEGRIKSWNDERGFGFIEPAQGGDDIFVHISAIPTRWGRPQPGQPLSFEIGLNRDGKKRATNVGVPGPAVRARARKASRTAGRQHDRPAEWSLASAIAIPLFVALYLCMAHEAGPGRSLPCRWCATSGARRRFRSRSGSPWSPTWPSSSRTTPRC